MFSLPGHTIGDAWFAVHEGTAHCFFCTSPAPDPSWHWDIGHAVSADLRRWRYLGLTLRRGSAGSAGSAWDSQTLSTGSVVAYGGRFWMAYSGLRRGENPPTRKVHRVGLAVSDDLMHWPKCGHGPANERDPRQYERLGPAHGAYGQWRDPFLLVDDERVYQYVCARSRATDRGRRGAVGLAVSDDMSRWRVGPPLPVPPFAREIEVPQVYTIDGRYYLMCCAPARWLAPWFTRQFPGHRFGDGDYALVGEGPTGPFVLHGTGEILPADAEVRPYASRLVPWQGAWYLLGTVRSGEEQYLSDPIRVVVDAEGIRAAGAASGANAESDPGGGARR